MRAIAIVLLAASAAASEDARIIDVHKIWDGAPHNAFTDLTRYRNRWVCVFREGSAHVSPDGAIRVLVSGDGKEWRSAARISSDKGDLRDPKLSITPAGELMLTSAAALPKTASARHQTYAWFSRDAEHWGEPVAIGEPDFWLWRVTWNRGRAYAVGYCTAGDNFVRLYSSRDGRRFETLVARLFDRDFPNEAAMAFDPDGTAHILLRRDKGPQTAQFGTARSPYTDWSWKDLGAQVGGPQLLRLPDGRFVAGSRRYENRAHTALSWLDPAAGTLTEFLRLPSGGDTSYPGLVWFDHQLYVSYYSTHEGKTAIYVATVRLPER